WQGDLSTADPEAHPITGRFPDGEEIDDGVFYYKGIAAATTIRAGDALVMLDTGSVQDTQPLHQAVRRWDGERRLAAAVFSHHHVDHIFGLGPFEEEAASKRQPRPIAYGHEAIPWHFDRYRRTLGWNTAINIRQFALPPDRFRWPADYRYPDVTYERRLTFREGDLS